MLDLPVGLCGNIWVGFPLLMEIKMKLKAAVLVSTLALSLAAYGAAVTPDPAEPPATPAGGAPAAGLTGGALVGAAIVVGTILVVAGVAGDNDDNVLPAAGTGTGTR